MGKGRSVKSKCQPVWVSGVYILFYFPALPPLFLTHWCSPYVKRRPITDALGFYASAVEGKRSPSLFLLYCLGSGLATKWAPVSQDRGNVTWAKLVSPSIFSSDFMSSRCFLESNEWQLDWTSDCEEVAAAAGETSILLLSVGCVTVSLHPLIF